MGLPAQLLTLLTLALTLRTAAAQCCCDSERVHADCCSGNTSVWLDCQAERCPGPGPFFSRPDNCGSSTPWMDRECACASSDIFPVGALVLMIVVVFLLVHFALWSLCTLWRPAGCCERSEGSDSRRRSASGSSRQALAADAAPPGYEDPPSYNQAAAAGAGRDAWELGVPALEWECIGRGDLPPDPPPYDTIFTVSLRVAAAAPGPGGAGSVEDSLRPEGCAGCADSAGGGGEERRTWASYDNPAFDPSDCAEELHLTVPGLRVAPDEPAAAGPGQASEV